MYDIQPLSADGLDSGPYEVNAEDALDDFFDELDNEEHPPSQAYEEPPSYEHGSFESTHDTSSQTFQAPHNDSRFTHHDLRLVSKSAPTSPLRVIALIDFDAFYAQCETVRLGLPPEQPLAVQQWHAIIALNYPARNSGLKRGMSVDDCKRICPEIKLQHVATWREGDERWAYRDERDRMASEKAALEPYREESRKAFALIAESFEDASGVLLEKASIDEMYLDLSAPVHSILLEQYPELAATTDSEDDELPLPQVTHLDWSEDNVTNGEVHQIDWDDIAIKIGADIVRGLRQNIYNKLGYTASAGIASNKVLAKLGAGSKKPNNQTIIRPSSIPSFLSSIPYKKIRGLGRQLGDSLSESFPGTTTITDILPIPLEKFQSALGKEEGTWVYNVIRGVEFSEVAERSKPQSMLSQKTFTPPIPGIEKAEYWIRMFSKELFDRVVALDTPTSRRRPRTLAVNHHINGRFGPTRRKQASFPPGSAFSPGLIFEVARGKLGEIEREGVSWPCAALGVVLSNFVEMENGSRDIKSFFFKAGMVDQKAKIGRVLQEPLDDRGRKEVVLSSKPAKRRKVSEMFASQRQSDKSSSEIGYLCPKCRSKIPESTVLEHLDWHMAVELQDAG